MWVCKTRFSSLFTHPLFENPITWMGMAIAGELLACIRLLAVYDRCCDSPALLRTSVRCDNSRLSQRLSSNPLAPSYLVPRLPIFYAYAYAYARTCSLRHAGRCVHPLAARRVHHGSAAWPRVAYLPHLLGCYPRMDREHQVGGPQPATLARRQVVRLVKHCDGKTPAGSIVIVLLSLP